MWVATTVKQLRQRRSALLGKVVLVPTLGALTDGHISLIKKGQSVAPNVIVSIFVNPTQFGPDEDYDQYPRPIEADLAVCRKCGITGVFHPSVNQMYPPQVPHCQVTIPALASILEGEHRPQHFAGVCRVVLKLFNMVQPALACFGKKDFQQLRILQILAADLNLPTTIVACETVRDEQGLALSSRNVQLNAEQYRRALGLFEALGQAKALVERAGQTDPQRVETSMRQAMAGHQIDVDYAVVRHPLTLAELPRIEPQFTGSVVALVAGHVDGVRLIDNMVLGREEGCVSV